jgi:hypothetical protein
MNSLMSKMPSTSSSGINTVFSFQIALGNMLDERGHGADGGVRGDDTGRDRSASRGSGLSNALEGSCATVPAGWSVLDVVVTSSRKGCGPELELDDDEVLILEEDTSLICKTHKPEKREQVRITY